MRKDNNSGLMHQELSFLWMSSYRLTNICCGSDSTCRTAAATDI